MTDDANEDSDEETNETVDCATEDEGMFFLNCELAPCTHLFTEIYI